MSFHQSTKAFSFAVVGAAVIAISAFVEPSLPSAFGGLTGMVFILLGVHTLTS